MGNLFTGDWTYRSLLNDPDVQTDFKRSGIRPRTLSFTEPAPGELGGTIGGPGWSLALHGSVGYGSPAQIRFQGKGVVGGEQWIYDYIGWLVPVWPNSTDQLQTAAIVGSGDAHHSPFRERGSTHPAGVVASFYAARAS